MKRLALLLLLIPLAFAEWQGVAALAIGTSVTLLAIVYMIGMGFGINELQMMAKEELFQVIAVLIMLALLVGADSILNTFTTGVIMKGGTATSMQAAGMEILVDTKDQVSSLFTSIRDVDHAVALEASKGGSCSVLQVGYSMSGCGGWSMIPTPLSMSGNIAGFALGELSAMIRLMEISNGFAMQFLLPLGIILRTFKLTRGAGGFLIALAISLYLMLPMGIIFNEIMAITFLHPEAVAGQTIPAETVTLIAQYEPAIVTEPIGIGKCNPMEAPSLIGNAVAGSGVITCPDGLDIDAIITALGASDNDGNSVATYCGLRAHIKAYLYLILIRATLGPAIALLLLTTGIRTLTSIGGAEVDVSAISRFV